MILPGCLAAFILPVVGALVGHWWRGTEASMWGALIGLVVGSLILAVLMLVLRHVKKHG